MTTISTNNQQGAVPLIGRILLAVLFILSGVSKLANPAGTQGYIASVGLPLPLLGYIVALVVEIGGGVMLLVGYRTRGAAIALAVYTVAAGVLLHQSFWGQNQFSLF